MNSSQDSGSRTMWDALWEAKSFVDLRYGSQLIYGSGIGQKAFDVIMASRVSEFIKQELSSARVYGEGRGIRIPCPDIESLEDIFLLLKIKLAN